jgi:DNA-binding NarL/FixJ family response regulator
MSITVFVVDDHALVRQGIVQLVNSESDLTVVGDGGGSPESLDAIRRLKPQVVSLDLEMPEVRGADFIGRVQSASPTSRVLVCTMHGHYAYVAEALRCGADGYVLKSSPSSLLIEGIRRVAAGKGLIDPALQTDVIKHLQSPTVPGATQDLTAREIEVLRLAAEGMSNHEIAKRTAQSVETVKLRLRRSFQKLGAADRVNAVALAMRRHLIS